MKTERNTALLIVEIAAVILSLVIFGIPFLFAIFNAGKTVSESSVI